MRNGTDVNTMLPYLSTYMGHSGIDSTLYYVHTSPDFMDSYTRAVRKSANTVIPENDARMKHNPVTGAPDFFVFARNFLHSYLAKVRKWSPATITAYRLSLECFLISRHHRWWQATDNDHLR